MSQFFASDGQSIGVSASASVLPMKIQGWFPLGLTALISLLYKRFSRVFSNTTARKNQLFGAQLSLWSNSHIHSWLLKKTTALPRCTFASKAMSLIFNTLSSFVIAFLPRSKHLLISWLQSPSAVILEPNIPIYLPWSDGTGCHDLSFWMLSFKPAFSFSSFTSIKRLFSSSSLSNIGVVSSAYLTLLIFLLAVLVPVCASSIPVFCMMYSVYKLNKQDDNIQLWHILFLILNQSILPCPVLTVASWPVCRFLRKQVRWNTRPRSILNIK